MRVPFLLRAFIAARRAMRARVAEEQAAMKRVVQQEKRAEEGRDEAQARAHEEPTPMTAGRRDEEHAATSPPQVRAFDLT